jgi:transposase
MSTTAPKPVTTPIPVQLSEHEFTAFILPHLSMPRRGPKCTLGYHRVFNLILWLLYTGMQWQCLPVPIDTNGNPVIHYTTVYKVFARWADDGPLWQAFVSSVRHLAAEQQLSISACCMAMGPTPWPKKGGMGLGSRGTNTKRARQSSPSSTIMATSSRLSRWRLSMRPTWSLPEGLRALKKVAKEVNLDLRGAYLNLDGGFNSTHNRKCMFNAGMIPNIKENPRNRKGTKRGRKRLFNTVIHALRMRVERTFAWEDKFKRLLLRFERIQQRHYGLKVMAYTLINLRAFCGA